VKKLYSKAWICGLVVEYLPSMLETLDMILNIQKKKEPNKPYWLMSVRLATWETKIRRILDKGNTGQKVYEISSSK
jgi:hypothetical protein